MRQVLIQQPSKSRLLNKLTAKRTSRGKESVGFHRLNVSSSAIRWVGWSPDDSGAGTLRIKFKNGSLYDYFDVSQAAIVALIRAGSVGRAFWRNVRDTYAYVRLA